MYDTDFERVRLARFFQESYNNETYTAFGLKWIENTTMKSVFVRHYPDLLPHITETNVFAKRWAGGAPFINDTNAANPEAIAAAGRVYAEHYAKKRKPGQPSHGAKKPCGHESHGQEGHECRNPDVASD